MNYEKSHTLNIPAIAHGFFGREGGVSEGIFASLNCGPGSGDNLEHVRENRKRIANAFDLQEWRVLTLHQTHSATVHTVTDHWPMTERPEGDAMVTAKPRMILGILTADCGPVLFADPVNRVIGAAHAGWKGAFGGVLESTVSAMEALGAKRGSIAAALGPCIGKASYEVGEEFVARFREKNTRYMDYFTPRKDAGKHLFDLKYFIKDKLQLIGINEISVSANDTCADEKRHFSYRRSCLRGEQGYGRQISCIVLEK